MIIIAIDPGPIESGHVMFDVDTTNVLMAVSRPNKHIETSLSSLSTDPLYHMAIEMYANYGMPCGQSGFETCAQIGRFEKSCEPMVHKRIFRKEVAVTLCGSVKAKDTNIRQQIIDMYGGIERAIGGRKCNKCKGKGWFGAGRPMCTSCRGSGWNTHPGPLFDVTGHAWSALGIALTYAIQSGYLNPWVVNPAGLCKNSQQ
ncbi:MAG: hypothetical protein ACYSTZ_00245 [Planctomycetota bacterium]|jgi:hypothetical protein